MKLLFSTSATKTSRVSGSVAVKSSRIVDMLPVNVNVPAAGLYSSVLARQFAATLPAKHAAESRRLTHLRLLCCATHEKIYFPK